MSTPDQLRARGFVRALDEASAKIREIAESRGHHGSETVRLFQEWCRERARQVEKQAKARP